MNTPAEDRSRPCPTCPFFTLIPGGGVNGEDVYRGVVDAKLPEDHTHCRVYRPGKPCKGPQ